MVLHTTELTLVSRWDIIGPLNTSTLPLLPQKRLLLLRWWTSASWKWIETKMFSAKERLLTHAHTRVHTPPCDWASSLQSAPCLSSALTLCQRLWNEIIMCEMSRPLTPSHDAGWANQGEVDDRWWWEIACRWLRRGLGHTAYCTAFFFIKKKKEKKNLRRGVLIRPEIEIMEA